MNLVDNTEHRKTVTQFISEKLLNIFEYALGVINDVTDNSEKYSNTEYRNAILLADLTVLSRCLQFDFIGCKGEEGSEGHVGIRNTYLRLIKFYGEDNVSVTVSSIPYYRSSIAIEIPWLSK